MKEVLRFWLQLGDPRQQAEMAGRKGPNLQSKEIQRRDSTVANCIYVRTYIYIHIYVCIYIYMYVHIYICIRYISRHIHYTLYIIHYTLYIYTCVYVYKYIYKYIHIHIHICRIFSLADYLCDLLRLEVFVLMQCHSSWRILNYTTRCSKLSNIFFGKDVIYTCE